MCKVSVIITTYKATEKLQEAIESVLHQTYLDYEIIVVDDNDPDTESRRYTECIMNRYSDEKRIVYIQHEKNKNGSAARNTGLRKATGEYISFLDDDDWYYPERLLKCSEQLDKFSDYGAVYTSVDVFRNGKIVNHRDAEKSGFLWKELLLKEGLLGTGSNIFLRKKSVEEVGFFDERFERYQDVEYMLRFLQRNKILGLNEILVRKNIRDRSNIPDYRRYKANKKLIFDKFGYLIEKLSDEERKIFLDYHYTTLFNAAVRSCNKEYIKEALNDYIDIEHRVTTREKLIAMMPYIYKLYLNIRIG